MTGSRGRIGNLLRWRIRKLTVALTALSVSPQPRPVMKILCFVCGGLGDRLMALPALRMLKNQYPGAAMTVAWMDGDLLPVEGEFTRSIHHARKHPRTLAGIAAGRWDLVYASSQSVFSVLVEVCAAASRAPVRIGPVIPGSSRSVYTKPYPFDTAVHATRLNTRALDGDRGVDPLPYPVVLSAEGPQTIGKPRILLHPGCGRGYERKRWPRSRFWSLGRRLADEGRYEVAFVAGPGEEVADDDAFQVIRPGSTTDLLLLLRDSALLIANDSGPAHAAAATGAAVVVIFGPTDPRRVAPVFTRGEVVRAPVPCAPCFDKPDECVGKGECMEKITVEQVYEAAIRLLAPKSCS